MKRFSLILSDLVWSCLILSDPVWSCLILSDPVWYCLILSDPVWSCMILSVVRHIYKITNNNVSFSYLKYEFVSPLLINPPLFPIWWDLNFFKMGFHIWDPSLFMVKFIMVKIPISDWNLCMIKIPKWNINEFLHARNS